jgi:ABC-type glutathione transport system ATPase component
MLSVDINNIILNNNNTSRELLGSIKFKIAKNNIYTVLGKNGSGKSTLIKSLTGLLNEQLYKVNGKVLLLEENIFKMTYNRLIELHKKEIKYVLQDLTNNFDPLKKIKYYFEKSGFDIDTISTRLKEYLLPDYKTISDLHSYEISGGMAQRLNLMLAILSSPKLLILDEPTSAIDYANINLIKIKILEYKKFGGSALIVTQDIKFAKEVSDEIAFLHDGKLSDFVKSEIFFKDIAQKPYNNFLNSFNVLQ